MAPPKDSFGDLVGSMGMPAPVQPVAVTNGETKAEDVEISPGKSDYICTLLTCFLDHLNSHRFTFRMRDLFDSISQHFFFHL